MDARGALRSRRALSGIAFDTNILAYAEGLFIVPADERKIAESRSLVRKLSFQRRRPQAAMQTMLELHNLLRRKGRFTLAAAQDSVARVRELVDLTSTDEAVLDAALALTARHELTIFDAVILSAAAFADCDILLSEDMQNGFTWRGVTVVNPFTEAGRRRLDRQLS